MAGDEPGGFHDRHVILLHAHAISGMEFKISTRRIAINAEQHGEQEALWTPNRKTHRIDAVCDFERRFHHQARGCRHGVHRPPGLLASSMGEGGWGTIRNQSHRFLPRESPSSSKLQALSASAIESFLPNLCELRASAVKCYPNSAYSMSLSKIQS